MASILGHALRISHGPCLSSALSELFRLVTVARFLRRLGEKMKTLDFPLSHFLALVLPVERRHTKGITDGDFLVSTDDRPDAALSAVEAAPQVDGSAGAAVTSAARCLSVPSLLRVESVSRLSRRVSRLQAA